MSYNDFDDDQDIMKARVAFLTGLLVLLVLIVAGVVLFKQGVFHKKAPTETPTVVEWDEDMTPVSENDEAVQTESNSVEENQGGETKPAEGQSAESNSDKSQSDENQGETSAQENAPDEASQSEMMADMQIEASSEEIKSDPEVTAQESTGATTDVQVILKSADAMENSNCTLGIDVSKYQGNINWQQVAASGIQFAMIRVGYRSLDTGVITEDANARYNLQEATANGIKAGAYFFSTAISEAEAVEEANFVINLIAKYRITYPVAYNCEGFEKPGNRQYGMSVAQRTACAKAFLNTIYGAGYTPMFYASKGEMENDRLWETSSLEKNYKVWVSWYPTATFPEITTPTYQGTYAMWQYTNQGIVNGISKACDINLAYFGYDQTANAHDETAPPEKVEANVEAEMSFTAVNEIVTAKEKTNLRDRPSQGEDSKVVYTLKNGEFVLKTGSSPSGWCKIEIDGKTYYAVERYLTTANEETNQTEQSQNNGELKTVFQTCDDWVTPKIEVNLRTIPSVTDANSQVIASVKNGENLHRIGINNDVGWSKVEYNGMILYCVSSYLNSVTQ